MKKICFVIQRYGSEVNGGAELHCRQLAEHLSDKADVTVLTSKAVDYVTWANQYSDREEMINGIRVIRFDTTREREQKEFDKINNLVVKHSLPHSREMEWLEKQGPMVPDLLQYIEDNIEEFDVFIFFTYLYYPTVIGVPKVADKAILIPTAHDEPPLYLQMMKDVFCRPRAIFYNTLDEKQLVNTIFHNEIVMSDIGGVGIELPEEIDPDRFRSKYSFSDEPFLLYVGRIDAGKGCGILFEYFMEYKKRNKSNLRLCLIGKSCMSIPERDDIIELGFVSDEDKYDAIAAANVVIIPSRFESLSMVILEAMASGTSVLANSTCEVLKGHCIRSNAGLYYSNYHEFEGCLNYYRDNPEATRIMQENGKEYVADNYNWTYIVDKLMKLVDYIETKNEVI